MGNIKNINLIGIGLGNPNLLTRAAYEAIKNSDIIIGARRVADSIKEDFKDKVYFIEYKTESIIKIIKENINSEIAVVFSGDVSLFSGSQKLFTK